MDVCPNRADWLLLADCHPPQAIKKSPQSHHSAGIFIELMLFKPAARSHA